MDDLTDFVGRARNAQAAIDRLGAGPPRPLPPMTFDVIALQTLVGDEVETLRTAVPAADALAVLYAEQRQALAGAYGAGVVVFLRPSDDPVAAVRARLAELQRGPTPETWTAATAGIREMAHDSLLAVAAYARADTADRRAACREALIRLAAAALKTVEDLAL